MGEFLRPGDVLAVKYMKRTDNTGHVMLVDGLPKRRKATELSIRIVDTDEGRTLNREYRGRDYATNVLSFPAPANPEDFVGDIALALGVMTREAAEQGKPLAHHLQHLVIHGVLHLIGYDHEDDGDAERMESLERALLAGLEVPDPYADDAP